MSRKEQWAEDQRFRLLGKRRCRKCNHVFDISQFPPKGLQVAHWCRNCRNSYARKLRLSMVTDPAVAERISLARENRVLYEQAKRKCKTCGVVKDLSFFPPQGYYKERRAYAASCYDCRGTNTARAQRTLKNKLLKPLGQKICAVCERQLPLTEFYAASTPGQTQSACRSCHNQRTTS